jgi:hypothetical protein
MHTRCGVLGGLVLARANESKHEAGNKTEHCLPDSRTGCGWCTALCGACGDHNFWSEWDNWKQAYCLHAICQHTYSYKEVPVCVFVCVRVCCVCVISLCVITLHKTTQFWATKTVSATRGKQSGSLLFASWDGSELFTRPSHNCWETRVLTTGLEGKGGASTKEIERWRNQNEKTRVIRVISLCFAPKTGLHISFHTK